MRGIKKLAVIGLIASLWGVVVLAQPRVEQAEIRLTNNQTNSVTWNVTGRIMEIRVIGSQTNGVLLATGAATGTVTVVATPVFDTDATATTLFTATMTNANVTARTRVLPTANTGAALSDLTVAEPYLSVGDSVKFQVVQEASGLTNVQWKCLMTID